MAEVYSLLGRLAELLQGVFILSLPVLALWRAFGRTPAAVCLYSRFPSNPGRRFLPESNAACFYLADGAWLIPEDRFERADMLRWLFWEQYNHEPNVATLRFWYG